MRRHRLLVPAALCAAALLTGCGGGGSARPAPTLPSLAPVSLAPAPPADLSAIKDTARLTGGYTGEACAALGTDQVRGLTGVPGTVEFAVRAGTRIGQDPVSSQTSCLYAAIASSVGLSLPSTQPPAADATYAAQTTQALVDCPGRASSTLRVLGLPATLITCRAQNSRVLALQGRQFAPGVVSSATCAVLNAEEVDENRFLGFCADAFRRAAG